MKNAAFGFRRDIVSKRLKTIKERYLKGWYIGGRLVGKTVFSEDMKWLIEQAERVEELESLALRQKKAKYKYMKQCQRYREVIKEHDENVAVYGDRKADQMLRQAIDGDHL